MNDVITLAGFLGVVSTTKVIKINLYNNETKNLRMILLLMDLFKKKITHLFFS